MLQIRDIHKTFHPDTPNEVRSLQGVTLDIEEGSFVIVLGTNGSGKSTLLNALAGSFYVDRGSIRLDEHELTRMPENGRARFIGRVFQNPFSGTAPNLTIAENLALASRRGQSRGLAMALGAAQRQQQHEAVARLGMGLEGRLDNLIGSLSGGQRQALTLLMATLVKPRLLLLDEHTAALDPKSADQVIRITAQVVARDRLTTLMVTHSMAQAVSLGDRLIMMHRGRVIADLSGAQKSRLRPDDLLDEAAAQMLAERFV